MPSLPLQGVLVVAVEQAVSAPMCSRHLADLGARVVKVEPRQGGDFTRGYDDAVRGESAFFVWLNRGKESLAIDLKHPAGLGVLERLLARADVLVQNLAPGAAARLGLAPAEVRQRHPRLTTVDISGYGVGGPLDARRAYDLLVQAEGGSCSVTGWPGAPAKPGIAVADLATGLYAASAVLAALLARERTGRGSAVSVAMFDVIAEWMGSALQTSLHTGVDPQPVGLGSPLVAPYGAYPTADGHTVLLGTTNDAEWKRLALQVLQRPDLASDPALATNPDRVQARERLDDAIGAWVSLRTLGEVQRAAEAARIGHARLNSVADVVTHPQLVERDRWVEVGSPVGDIPVLLPPLSCAEWPTPRGPVPALGSGTDGLLAELGYTPEEAAELAAAGAAGAAPGETTR